MEEEALILLALNLVMESWDVYFSAYTLKFLPKRLAKRLLEVVRSLGWEYQSMEVMTCYFRGIQIVEVGL